MFCTKCGANLPDGTVFCTNCGAKVGEETIKKEVNPSVSNPVAYDNQPQKKDSSKMIGMVVVGVVAILAIVVLFKIVGAFTTPGYEKPIKYMVESLQKGKFDTMMKAFPDYLKDSIEDSMEYMYDDGDEFMEEMVDELKDTYGKNYKITYKIEDKDKLKKGEIEDLEDEIDDYYDEKVKIKEAYELDVEMNIKGKEDKDSSNTTITVIKIGSKWYSTSNMFQ